ncbi:serine/threonine-protein kinase [Aureimonas psammosilenae]|uniref:serine/threonine-protein kinase n=1 Tax=Aureimonas psammosilenae TaxID=2495496 RepID=UPI001260DB58|nr:serine/threonine-protein kinase [Aureimonas psammosilenae]
MLKPYNKAEVAFDFIREIGQHGRNSRTWLSRDHQLDAEIVTKQIAKAKLGDPDEFFAESKALYASAHPNVVQIHYACQDAGHVYVAMPYYERGSVKDLISNGRFMTVREIVAVGCQTLSGLHNIHSKRLVHFDVKPDNILLSLRGEALLSDFGQAKRMNFVGVAEQDRHYTPMIPPEAMRNAEFDVTFDVYQIGLTLYRMCVGNGAFYEQLAKYGRGITDRDGFRFDVRNGRFPDRSTFPAHIPSKLRNIVRKCLQVDPAQRYPSALAVANALSGIDDLTFDWRMTRTPDNTTWTKNENGTEYSFVLNPDRSCELTKTVNGGRRTRVRDECRANISEKEVQKVLGSY